ncbi:MAG: IS21 family transposase, partial [Syntrophales bacterium LBB04]|nr:IS21 family transposase [Syntrophales bacterium LBB04]
MAKERLSMNKLKEILRLKHECKLSNRKIARSIQTSHSTVSDYLNRAQKHGISWPIPEEWDEVKLQSVLCPEPDSEKREKKVLPDFSVITRELRRKGVTLQLLWEEYREVYSHGYAYSHYCYLYEQFQKKRDYVLRQDYKGGEKLFVDFAGPTVPIHERLKGEIREAQIFVSCLGA